MASYRLSPRTLAALTAHCARALHVPRHAVSVFEEQTPVGHLWCMVSGSLHNAPTEGVRDVLLALRAFRASHGLYSHTDSILSADPLDPPDDAPAT